MSRILLTTAAAVIALMVSFAIPGSLFAAEQHRDGMRNRDRELSAARQHHKRAAPRVVADRGFNDEPYAGHRTDIADNSYFYYRLGSETPFGPGRGLRPPYPR
jgi:hypothetical protein